VRLSWCLLFLNKQHTCTGCTMCWNGLAAASQLLSHRLRVGWWCWPIILTKSFVLWVLYHWNLRRDTWVSTMLVIISYWQHKVNNLQSRKVLHSKTAKFPSKSWESTVFATVTFWEGCQNQELYGLKLFHFSQKQLVWHVD
jgi:hypothetical protein